MAFSQIALRDEFLMLHGDIQTGYFGQMGTNRDGSWRSVHELRNRTRIGVMGKPNLKWEWRMRYAMQFKNGNAKFSPGWHIIVPRNNGILMGEGTFDMAFLAYRPVTPLWIRAGRMQTRFTLPGVVSKAIIRNQSSNTEVRWADGIHISYAFAEQWQTDLIFSRHQNYTPSNTIWLPEDTTKIEKPFSIFGELAYRPTHKNIHWTAIDVTYIPDALFMDVAFRKSGYIAASVKSLLKWNMGSESDLTWGLEVAYSFNRPEKSIYISNIDETEFDDASSAQKIGGAGFQTNVSLINIAAGHDIGMVATFVQPSLLTAFNYWKNKILFEIRHDWQFTNRFSIESRLQYRGDMYKFDDVNAKLQVFYPYSRLTYRLR